MFQRLDSFVDLDEELLPSDGVYSRDQFERMNQEFTTAVLRAFELGLESRAAAAATVRVKSSLNGSRRLAEEAAIGAAWDLLCSRKGEMAAAEVLAFVRELCPIDPVRVRAALEQRVRRGVGW